MTALHKVELTDDEVLRLADVDRPKVKAAVALAKERRRLEATGLEPGEARFIADLRVEAAVQGQLIFRFVDLRYGCQYSGEKPERVPYRGRKRSLRGTTVAIPIRGREFAHRFLRMQGLGVLACSLTFFEKIQPKLAEYLTDIAAEIPEQITGHPPKWKRYDNRRCTKCGWEGHQGEMVMAPALISGSYPAACPECDAENAPLGRTLVERRDGFTCVEVPGA